MPPIDSHVFREQVAAARLAANKTEPDASLQLSCTLCKKLYRNRNAYQNHVKSQEHVANLDKHGSSASKDELDSIQDAELSVDRLDLSSILRSETDEDYNPNSPIDLPSLSKCLFCNFKSTVLELNVDHMYKAHGMFIPDQDYLYDLEIFIEYLSKVVSEFCTCLYCGKTKDTAESVQQHMRDKGHCMLNFDDLSEYEPFYDFSSDSEAEFADASATGNDEDSTKLKKPPKAARWERSDSKSSDLELHLSSGKILGHRSQSHIYRQNLHNVHTSPETTEPKAIAEAESSEKHDASPNQGRQIATYASGGTGMIGVPEQQKRALIAVEKKLLKQEIRARTEYRWIVEKKANQQKHFNVSVLAKQIGCC